MKAMLRTIVGASLVCICAEFPVLTHAAEPSTTQGQPRLVIDQKMPESLEPGAAFYIDVLVRNVGDAVAEGLTVTDLLPTGYELLGVAPTPERTADGLIWRMARLGPGEQATMRMRLGPKMVTTAAAPRNVVDATFQVRANSVCTSQIKKPDLTLTVAAPDAVFTGQTVGLKITLGNNGTGAAHEVVLHAVMGEGLTAPGGSDLETTIGELKPGESRVVNLQAAASRPGDLRGSVSLLAQGISAVQKDIVCHAEDNHLNVTATGPTALHYDFTGLYGLSVVNDGATPIHQVVLTAVLPPGLTFVRASDNGAYDPTTRTLTWNLNELKAGEQRDLAWNGTAQAAGDLKATIRLMAGQQLRREIAWTTRVVEDSSVRQAVSTATKTPGE